MTLTTKLISLAGASALMAFAAPVAPAFADTKPCCYNNGQYFESSPSTCRNYGGRVVEYEYCARYNGYGYNGGYNSGYYNDGYYGSRGPNVSFSIDLGGVVFGYTDGYYDRYRRWHRWRNDRERAYFIQHRRHAYYNIRRDNDHDRNRRDWREGRRRDWN